MVARHPHLNRVISRVAPVKDFPKSARPDAPRMLGGRRIDISSLHLPPSVRCALAEAFWSQQGAKRASTMLNDWYRLTVFARFARDTGALRSLRDVNSALITRYIDWLNQQKTPAGTPWRRKTREGPYDTLRQLLRWLQQCRPDLIGEFEIPRRPFKYNKTAGDHRSTSRLSAEQLREILQVCEQEIQKLRSKRAEAAQAMAAARDQPFEKISTVGELLLCIDHRYNGIFPRYADLTGVQSRLMRPLFEHGGLRELEPCLYPCAESILPYYLAILIHAAGNPTAIGELTVDCLQPVPLLDDRELLVWNKARAAGPQRRSFRTTTSFEPPMLVREVLHWTQRLRSHAPAALSNRLFLYKSNLGVTALTQQMAYLLQQSFATAHRLPDFHTASIRPSVLTAFYRACGDLRQVKEIANHVQLSTTVGYVEGPEVATQNRVRIAVLQSAFVGHISSTVANATPRVDVKVEQSGSALSTSSSRAMSMFGFDCKDPLAGIAPGTLRGEFCTHFLGCFTCPNAVITADATLLARLLQARDHLRAATGHLHPARWEAIYAPQLRILEEDILTRFSNSELVAAEPLRATLPPLPELR